MAKDRVDVHTYTYRKLPNCKVKTDFLRNRLFRSHDAAAVAIYVEYINRYNFMRESQDNVVAAV